MNSDYTLMKKKNIYILLLLAPVLFASCKVGKSYVRPEMALPDSLMQQQDSISIAGCSSGRLFIQTILCVI